MQLASNPYMLNMLWSVWKRGRALPSNRGDLFAGFIKNLLHREHLLTKGPDTPTPEGERLLAGLGELGWGMQHESGDSGVLTVVSPAVALQAFGGDEELLAKAVDSTLLEGTAELRFRHQLLQEYFTARALSARLGQTPAATLWPPDRWWERNGWEETAVLLAGLNPADCTPVIDWLSEAQPEVAAQCISDGGARVPERFLGELSAAWRARFDGVRREPRPEARAAIGRALGRLKLDTRKGVGLRPDGLPEIDWVEIPAGEFIYQEGERRKIERYFIARYPVTNLQYQAFLEAGDGYGDDRWWKGLTSPDRTPGISAWTESNHPRERVSWHESMAFCGWLSHKLGYEVSLPTEWQWERAARGTDGREYPWGEKYVPGYANINETYGKAGPHNLGRTSAVGLYAEGGSAEGVMDLSGNVWEWCLNEYGKPKRIQPGGTESRVLRGGSWFNDREYARAAFRFHLHPGSRGFSIGLRVVCSSPIH
jgi:Sulfatase-modifying factor enzyme 1